MSLFTETDQERIKNAVKEAEQKSSGEIVPVIVSESADYPEVFWKLLTFFNTIWATGIIVWFEYSTVWHELGIFEMLLIGLAIGLVSTLIVVRLPVVIRLLADKDSISRAVSARAAEAFISYEVFKTRERSGILIFISELEHRVLVIGDSGINAKVKSGTWDELVKSLIISIKNKKAADGIISAVETCGTILEQAGLTRRADDTNELSDEIRMEN